MGENRQKSAIFDTPYVKIIAKICKKSAISKSANLEFDS